MCVKWQPTEYDFPPSYTSERGLIYRIYKELITKIKPNHQGSNGV